MQALFALPANFLANALFLLDNKFSKEKCLLTTLGIFLEFLSRNAFLRSVFEAILRNVASVVQWPPRPLSGLLLRGALLPRFDTLPTILCCPDNNDNRILFAAGIHVYKYISIIIN